MNEVVSDNYLEKLLSNYSQQSVSTLPWLGQMRSEALDRVSTLKIPTTRDEEWRFTDLSPLAKVPFRTVQAATLLQDEDIQPYILQEAVNRLVFIDGQYAPQLSEIDQKTGVVAGNLLTLLAQCPSKLATHLGQYANSSDDFFTALNTAFLQDGAIIIVPSEVSVMSPIQFLFLATQKEVSSFPRCLVVAGSGSHVIIFEDYVALREASYITNTVTEMCVADSAHVNHIRLQRDSSQAFHIANCTARLAQSSRFFSTSVTLGARISRCNLNVQLAGDGAECIVNGLALIKKRQLADTHTSIDHIKPNGTSHQIHKCIVDDAARAVFNGKIKVQPDAQQTDSSQTSRNLLLSGEAQLDTKPQLEIFANDVKCAHGATVSQLDQEEIFYLRSRGLSEQDAQNLLAYAFGAEIVDRISIASLRNQLTQAVHQYILSCES